MVSVPFVCPLSAEEEVGKWHHLDVALRLLSPLAGWWGSGRITALFWDDSQEVGASASRDRRPWRVGWAPLRVTPISALRGGKGRLGGGEMPGS